MKPVFQQSKNKFFPTVYTEPVHHEVLPPEVFAVRLDPLMGYYLELMPSFERPKKVYGNPDRLVQRFLTTYQDRGSNTGILLNGEKGSGKTLTAKLLAIAANNIGMPVLIIDEAHHGAAFNSFLGMILQPAMIMFDEYEKVYSNYEVQDQLLTVLDGVYPSKKLFVLTSNAYTGINSHMTNRPGRVFYSIEYDRLDTSFVKEYCLDNLKDQSQLPGLMKLSAIFDRFNFDTLAALVNEMNRYEESAADAARFLNITLTGRIEFVLKLLVDGKERTIYPNTSTGHPLVQSQYNIRDDTDELTNEDEDQDLTVFYQFLPEHLKEINDETGVYFFVKEVDGKEVELQVERKKDKSYGLNHPYMGAVRTDSDYYPW